jgi:hypothetical protein
MDFKHRLQEFYLGITEAYKNASIRPLPSWDNLSRIRVLYILNCKFPPEISQEILSFWPESRSVRNKRLQLTQFSPTEPFSNIRSEHFPHKHGRFGNRTPKRSKLNQETLLLIIKRRNHDAREWLCPGSDSRISIVLVFRVPGAEGGSHNEGCVPNLAVSLEREIH